MRRSFAINRPLLVAVLAFALFMAALITHYLVHHNQMTGTITESPTSSVFCIGRDDARGDCFTGSSAQVAHLRMNDCITVHFRRTHQPHALATATSITPSTSCH